MYSSTMYMSYFLIGASGSGKTSAVRALDKAGRSDLKIFFFDAIGVPSEQEQIEKWGSGAGWQRAMTVEWVKRMKAELAHSNVLLDGQTRPSFITEACEINDVKSYKVILVHCSDEVRQARLLKRGQPELANEQMMEWGRYLLMETRRIGEKVSTMIICRFRDRYCY